MPNGARVGLTCPLWSIGERDRSRNGFRPYQPSIAEYSTDVWAVAGALSPGDPALISEVEREIKPVGLVPAYGGDHLVPCSSGAWNWIMGRRIESSIEIDAPPERVWDILTDFERMPDWNPFITAISGPLKAGGRLSVQITAPGKAAMTFEPTVTVLKTEHELRWLGRFLMPGILDGEHSFILTSVGSGRVKFTQSEAFSGVLVGMLGSVLSATEAGFNAMNEALKRRAEGRV